MPLSSEQISTLMKEIRLELGLSQEDLARELGISFATVNRWENGRVKPSKLGRAQLDAFYSKMISAGELTVQRDIA